MDSVNQKSETKKPVPLMLRLPPDVHRRLVDRATSNDRSMNGEIVAILENALDRPHRLELDRFKYEYERMNRELATLRKMLSEGEERRDALLREMQAHGAFSGDDTPR